MSADNPLNEARGLLRAGDPRAAFRTLQPIVGYPGQVEADGDFTAAFDVLAQIARAIAGDELGAQVAAVAVAPDEPTGLFEAAYALYEQRLYPIAATLLARANRLVPGTADIVTELCANFEAMMAYDAARQTLEASGLPGRDPMCTYLHGFCGIMGGDVELARSRAGDLARLGGDELMVSLRATLEGMVARADAVGRAVPLHERELSGWQAVIDGSILLHESPHGFDAGMNGRYAFVADSASLMREGLDRLRVVLDASDRRPARVLAAPDRASRILASAAGCLFEVPLAVWTPGEPPSGLVIAWSLDHVGDPQFLQALREHAADQVLFAHASGWVDPFPYAPDVTTLLHQHITHPWMGGAMRIDPDTREVTAAPPDERSDEILAQLIVEAAPSDDEPVSSIEKVLAVTRALRSLPPEHTGGLYRHAGLRARQRAGSPVASNRFS